MPDAVELALVFEASARADVEVFGAVGRAAIRLVRL